MKRSNILLAILVALMFTGCSTSKLSITPSQSIVDIPPIGNVMVSELGETLVQKGKVYQYDAIQLNNTVEAGDGFLLKKLTLNPGILKASMRDNKYVYYSTDKLMVYDALLGTKMEYGGLAVSDIDADDVKFHLSGKKVMRPKPKPDFVKIKTAAIERPSFRQELIYNGKTGNYVKFLYREYSGDMMRPPFSQEIQYDLNEGKTVGFKGERIEILDASNTSIPYRVLATFPDLQ